MHIKFLELLISTQINILQIIVAALIGSIVGEMRKEFVEDDDDKPPEAVKFFSEIIVATFIGTIISIIILELHIFQSKQTFILIISALSGYIGYKSAFSMFTSIVINLTELNNNNTGKTIKKILTTTQKNEKEDSDNKENDT